ncbi:Rrp15p-domain-containing protein [Chytridium lagenaria]|nr:Rrp15p-domain-containing protein [Chytridium lagenaria]
MQYDFDNSDTSFFAFYNQSNMSDDGHEDVEMQEQGQQQQADSAVVVEGGKMASVMSRLLTRELKGKKSKPILAQSRGIEMKLDDSKLEIKAKQLMKLETQQKKNSCRVKPEVLTNDLEKRLRKISTRGVVKLFNAIAAEQKGVAEATSALKPKPKKTSFLQMVEADPSLVPT